MHPDYCHWGDAPASCCLHGPIAHHLVPLGRIDLDVRVVHEAVDADAGAKETSKGETDLKGVGRGIGEPMFLRVGASHGRSLVVINKCLGRSDRRGEDCMPVRGGHGALDQEFEFEYFEILS